MLGNLPKAAAGFGGGPKLSLIKVVILPKLKKRKIIARRIPPHLRIIFVSFVVLLRVGIY